MVEQRDPHAGLHSAQGALAGEHPGRVVEPGGEGARPGVVGVREAGPGAGGAVRPRVRVRDGAAHRARAAAAGHRRRGAVRADPQGPAVAVRRHGVPRGGPVRRGPPGRRHRADGRGAAGEPGRGRGGPGRSERGHGCGSSPIPHELPALPGQEPLSWNVGHTVTRTNATQRPPRAPALVQRLGHVVLQSNRYVQTLDWYLQHLGLIVSDFLYYAGQRERGPVMSFIRCDRGVTPTDHHTLAMALGPSNRYVHSAYQVSDLDALAAGGEYLREHGYHRSWGIGRHIQGSQIFDYWRDPDGFLVEHFSDGDLFDNTLEPGWAPMTASGLAQWGPPATKDFLGITPGRESLQELRRHRPRAARATPSSTCAGCAAC